MTELASFRSSWPIVHGGVFLLTLVPVACLPSITWPWHLVLPLSSYLILVLLVPPLRRTMPWPRAGRLDRIGVAGAIGLCAASSAVLLGFQAMFAPDVMPLARKLPAVIFGNVLAAGLCISVVNAVLEELLCRWVLYEVVAAEWGVVTAILATAAFFGAAHMDGYPPGPLGMVLAGAYGVGLALLRWWSGGLGLSMACHVCADVTILRIISSHPSFS